MVQAPIDPDLQTLLQADPSALLTQADGEYRALVIKVFCTAVASALALLYAQRLDAADLDKAHAQAKPRLQAVLNAKGGAGASPISGGSTAAVRGFPASTLSPQYAYVHIHAH